MQNATSWEEILQAAALCRGFCFGSCRDHSVAIYLLSGPTTIYYYTFWNQMMKKCHRAINTFSLTVKVKHIKNDTAFVLWNHISCWWPQIGRDWYCLRPPPSWKSSSFSSIIAGLSFIGRTLVLRTSLTSPNIRKGGFLARGTSGHCDFTQHLSKRFWHFVG